MQSVVDRGTVDARLPFFDPCEGQRQVAMVDLMKAGERERRRLQEEVRAAVERMVTQVEDEETPEEKKEREMYARAEIEATLTAEAEADDAKVTGELVRVLYANQIKEMKKLPGVWPERFAAKEGGVETRADDVYDDDSALARGRRKTPSDGCASSSEEDDDLPPPNRNRPPPPEQSESEEESSDEEDG